MNVSEISTEVCIGFLRITVSYLMIHILRIVKEINRYTFFKENEI